MPIKKGSVMNLEAKKYFIKGKDLFNKGEYKKAIHQIEQALAIEPDYADIYNYLALSYSMIGNHNTAIQYFKSALSINPEYIDAHINLSIIYTEIGKFKEAEKEYRVAFSLEHRVRGKTIGIKAHIANLHKDLANLYLSIGDYNASEDEFKKALDLAGMYPDIWISLGKLYMIQEKYKDALTAFDKSINTNKKFIEGYVEKGLALYKMKKMEEAKHVWHDGLKISPENVKIKVYLNLVETMEKRDEL